MHLENVIDETRDGTLFISAILSFRVAKRVGDGRS